MKSKLLIFIIIITVMIPLFALPALASSKVVNISRPEGNEIVFKEIFSICGSSVYDEATIELFYKDEEGEYQPLYTTEGESSFTVGKFFGKDIELSKGQNKIRIVAYTEETKSHPQIKNYTITLAEEKKDENVLKKMLNWITGTDTDTQVDAEASADTGTKTITDADEKK